MQHLIDQLVYAGLSEREAKVYLVTLNMGVANVKEIATASQISRTTIYNVLEALTALGLISHSHRDGKQCHVAAPPEYVIKMLKAKADDLLKRMKSLEEALPELMAVENHHGDRPRMYYFEGKTGVEQLAHRYEEVPGDFFEIVSYDKIREFFGENEFDDHKEILIKNQIKGRVLLVAKEPPVEFMKNLHKRFGWEMKYMPQDDSPMDGHVSVKGDEIYGFSYNGIPMGVVVENKAVASAIRKIFEMAWENAPADVSFLK